MVDVDRLFEDDVELVPVSVSVNCCQTDKILVNLFVGKLKGIDINRSSIKNNRMSHVLHSVVKSSSLELSVSWVVNLRVVVRNCSVFDGPFFFFFPLI